MAEKNTLSITTAKHPQPDTTLPLSPPSGCYANKIVIIIWITDYRHIVNFDCITGYVDTQPLIVLLSLDYCYS